METPYIYAMITEYEGINREFYVAVAIQVLALYYEGYGQVLSRVYAMSMERNETYTTKTDSP